jgi:hypothetical protein
VLVAYLVVVAETALLTTALSPLRLVTRAGLGVSEVLLLAVAAGVWHKRGRPRPAVRHVATALRALLRDPATAILLVVVAAALVYELVLGLTVPPNNWDSLTYHLTRVAAWAAHRGVYWVPNAPTARINEFQPLAEQEILFLFVATGKGTLYALPQFVAELATTAAIYLGARRLDFDLRQAACAALLFASLPLVALEATTSQNDLVAASLPAVAASLVLGSSRVELLLAGAAAGLGLGVKLTTALVLPVLALLALARGRSALRGFALACGGAFVVLGMWGFVLDVVKTGHVLGHGGGRVEQQASPSLTGSPATAFRVIYKLLDLSGMSGRLLEVLVAAGIAAGLGTFVAHRRRGGSARFASIAGAAVATPLLLPRLVPSIAHVLHLAADAVSLPVEARASTGGAFTWGVGYVANEDFSGFGPIGGLALLVTSLIVLTPWARRRVGDRLAIFGVAMPLFLVFLALTSKYNPWLNRFLLVPVALAAPLLALLFRHRAVAVAIAVVAAAGLIGVQLHNQLKPLRDGAVAPWRLTQAQAVALTGEPGAAGMASFAAALPKRSCVGAVLGSNEPAYLLFAHRSGGVVFLPAAGSVAAADRAHLTAVVIGQIPAIAVAFGKAGWRLRGLPAATSPRVWTLATAPNQPQAVAAAGCST